MIWEEKRIRDVIASIDKETGLSGAEVEIRFDNARQRLGCFSCQDDMYFSFSVNWFHNPEWPEEAALDVIRHEYAHYMDWMVYKKIGHGKTWKACCVKVGAVPVRLYSDSRCDYYKSKEITEKNRQQSLSKYEEGQTIKHPLYGNGTIISIKKNGRTLIAGVLFEHYGTKSLDLSWLEKTTKNSA